MAYQILLVDDDAAFREEICDCFYDDFRIVEAASGEDALRILAAPNDIDLVCMDVRLPGDTGTEVVRKIKQKYPRLSIVVLTGYGSKDVAVEALRANADDFIEKPIDVDATRRILEKHLSRRLEVLAVKKGGVNSKIERVKQYLEKNYQKKVFLKDAADAVCLSPKYLSRIFEQETGIGFSEYKLRIKVDKAKHLLETTDQNVDAISYALGYQNTESFIKVFRKITGRTPAAFRKESLLYKA